MRGIHFTLNGRTSKSSRNLKADEDSDFMRDWVLSKEEFRGNRIAIVIERPEEDEAHMHVLVEAGPELWKSSKPTEALSRWMKTRWAEFPADWKADGKSESFYAKPLVGAQTMEMTFGGYLQKEENIVAFKQGWDEEDVEKGRTDYLVASRKKETDLYETTYMQKALAYAKAKGMKESDLWEVLADMDGNGYSVAPLLSKRKITAQAVTYFSKKQRAGLSATEMRELLGSEDAQERPIPSLWLHGDILDKALGKKSMA